MQPLNLYKKIIAASLVVLVFMTVAPSTFAEEGSRLGNFSDTTLSGEVIENNDSAYAGGKLISLSNGVYYAPDDELFYQSVEGQSFGISVPNGAIVTDAVTTSLATSLSGALYKNGVELTGADLSYISEPGKYVLAVTANDSAQTVRVNFTIISSPTGAVKEYVMPDDFYVVSVTMDGEEMPYNQRLVDLSLDGDYVISYRSPEANKDMLLAVTIDHTAPTATLSGIVDGKANGPVTVSDMESGVRAYLVRNREQVTYSDTIEETGSYVLTLQDEAGNETVYDFVVVTYANSSFKVLLIACAVLLIALGGYLFYYRRSIRVS